MPRINPLLIAATLWLAPLPVSAQGMLDMVDMTSPEMAEAEMSRGQLEALLADASRDQPADLSWSRFNYADLEGANLSGARLDLTWFYKANWTGQTCRAVTCFPPSFNTPAWRMPISAAQGWWRIFETPTWRAPASMVPIWPRT